MLPLLFFAVGVIDLVLAVGFYRKGKRAPALLLAVTGAALAVLALVLLAAQRQTAP